MNHPRRTNERGSTIVLVSFAMAALLGMVALAVDVGMLFTARGEAQRAADASALAGAASLIEYPPEIVGNEEATTRAENLAIEYAAQNTVRDEIAELEPEDIEVNLEEDQVTVTVRRVASRDNAIGTWFARIFGIDQVDVAARATAEVQLAGAGTCMKPFTLPDAWDDLNGNGVYDAGEPYDPSQHGYGSDFRNGLANGIDLPDNGVDPEGTAYFFDFGRPLIIKEGNPQDAIVSSWYFPWDVPQPDGGPDTGADRYRENIAECNTSIVLIGVEYNVENGRMKGPTADGTRDLINLDPDAEWDLDADSVVGSAYQPWTASPRVANIPLFDPTEEINPGKKPVVFNNITSFFIEGMDGNDVIGRFLYAAGIAVPGDAPDGDDSGPQAKVIRLVE